MPKLITGQVVSFSFQAKDDAGLSLEGFYDHPKYPYKLAPVQSRILLSVANETDAFVADLVRVTVALHTADCAVRRPAGSKASPLGWRRRIAVTIPVRALSVWQSAQVELHQLLWWLTDDDWEVSFEQFSGGAPSKQPEFHVEHDSVGLFSGGLDSMAGFALDNVATGQAPIPFGISTNSRTTGLQKRSIRAYGKAVGRQGLRLERAFLKLPVRVENSQRTRGLLYLGLASAVASVYRVNSVKVYENGVGAINLPLIPSQASTKSSRSVHPRTLLLFADLVRKVLEHPIQFELPFLFQTKGQMYDRLVDYGLGDLAEVTKSCDCIPRQDAPCRMCTSCLLSRIAIGDIQTEEEVRQLTGDDAVARWAMRTHISDLHTALSEADPWKALSGRFPAVWAALEASAMLTGQPENLVQRRLLDMYQRFVQEWGRFSGSN